MIHIHFLHADSKGTLGACLRPCVQCNAHTTARHRSSCRACTHCPEMVNPPPKKKGEQTPETPPKKPSFGEKTCPLWRKTPQGGVHPKMGGFFLPYHQIWTCSGAAHPPKRHQPNILFNFPPSIHLHTGIPDPRHGLPRHFLTPPPPTILSTPCPPGSKILDVWSAKRRRNIRRKNQKE